MTCTVGASADENKAQMRRCAWCARPTICMLWKSAVAAGTTAEDVKVFVGGVDVTAGFKVAVEGTTATVVLKEPYETARTPHSARFAARLWLGGYR